MTDTAFTVPIRWPATLGQGTDDAADPETAAAIADSMTAAFLDAKELSRQAPEGAAITLVLTGPPELRWTPDGAMVAGLTALARSLARDWSDRHLRVNLVVVDGDAAELAEPVLDMVAAPCSTMLTGQVLRVNRGAAR